jgi:hypothetical protein
MDRVCHTSRPRAARPFVFTAYLPRGDRLAPELPDCCPSRREGDADCAVGVHGWRPRKTGPGFPLCVVECGTHGGAFTLYPPGHVPYGRTAIAAISSDGHAVVDAERGPGESAAAWEVTVFGAACDAACGRAWPRSACEGYASFRTQCRRVELGATLLGVLVASDAAQLVMATVLGVAALTLRDASGAFHAPSWRWYTHRARALLGPLAELERVGGVLERVLVAGGLIGQWGAAYRWESQARVLRLQTRGPP